jgi:hypothetical protein
MKLQKILNNIKDNLIYIWFLALYAFVKTFVLFVFWAVSSYYFVMLIGSIINQVPYTPFSVLIIEILTGITTLLLVFFPITFLSLMLIFHLRQWSTYKKEIAEYI